MTTTSARAARSAPPDPQAGHRPTTELKALLHRPTTARAAGAYDALSAVLVEKAELEVIWASSLLVSASRGLPDISLLTMTDQLEAAARMARAVSIPVLADCDTGFGSAVNVAYMVQMYEAAGLAGVCIEDKAFPKTNSFVAGGQELLGTDEFADKIACGVAARRDPDFVIVARVEALICGAGQAEALHRARAYAAAGADAILIHSKQREPDEVIAFVEAWDGAVPIVVVPTTYYGWTLDEMVDRRIAMAIYANHSLRAAIAAVSATLSSIRDAGSSVPVEGDIASLDDLFALQRMDDWRALER
jgi:phosphoenolpyruvate phosphomutase